MYLRFFLLNSCLFACWRRSNRSFPVVEKTRNHSITGCQVPCAFPAICSVMGACASFMQALNGSWTFAIQRDGFLHLWGLWKGSTSDVHVNILYFCETWIDFEVPWDFFRAAMILRCMPYKGCVSIGHKWLISWVKTPFPNFLKKKKS